MVGRLASADVAARVAALRRELSTDGGGGGDGAAPTTGVLPRARFRALVEVGTVLAAAPLPDYVPPVRKRDKCVLCVGRYEGKRIKMWNR